VEPVWSNLKRSLANLVKQDIGQLTMLVKTRLRRIQYQPGLLEGFLAKPRLDLTPSVTSTIERSYVKLLCQAACGAGWSRRQASAFRAR
jgi:hypothetical protein